MINKLFNNKIERNNFNNEEDDHATIGIAGKIKTSNKKKERIKCR